MAATTNFIITINGNESEGNDNSNSETNVVVPDTGRFTNPGANMTATNIVMPTAIIFMAVTIIAAFIATIKRKKTVFGIKSSRKDMIGFLSLLIAIVVSGSALLASVLGNFNANATTISEEGIEVESLGNVALSLGQGESGSVCDEITIPEATEGGFVLRMNTEGGLVNGEGEAFDGPWNYKIETPEAYKSVQDWQTVPKGEVELYSVEGYTDSDYSIKICFEIDATESEQVGVFTATASYTADAYLSTFSMQNVSEWGDDIEIGDTVEVIDERDGEVYTVARLADGKLWMTRNLRLDPGTAYITAENTNNPSEAFLNEITNATSSDVWWTSATSEATDGVLYNTSNLGDMTIGEDGNTYDEYGVYYNFYTASAGYGGSTLTENGINVPGDICPSGWHLPRGHAYLTEENSEYAALSIALGGYKDKNGISQDMNSETTPTGIAMVETLMSEPNNFVKSGSYAQSGTNMRGDKMAYWTATNYGEQNAGVMFYLGGSLDMDNRSSGKGYGSTIRCIAEPTNV